MSKSRKRRQRAQLRARAKSSRNPATRSLRYEPLEDRRMLAVVTVDTDQDVVDFSDGLTSLREAIFATNLVEGPDEIVFDFGHDGPATILLTEGAFRISDSLTITGSGAELLTIDASGNDPTPDEDNGDGSRIFSIDDGQLSSNIDVTISGLTLTGGDANTLGGAIVARENLTVEDSIIRSNSVRTGGGGGIAFVQPFRRRSSSDPLSAAPLLKIIRSTVQDNSMARSTGGVGGGIFIRGNVEVEISNSTISDNSTSGDLRHGGGIAIDQFRSGIATVTIIDSTISGNSTSGENSFGGGIYNYEGNLTIIGSNITANTTSGNQSSGGGIRSTNGNVKIVDSRITDNSVSGGAAWGGGLLFRGFDPAISLTVSRTTISGNSASGPFGNGGGLHIRGHKIAIIDSAIFNNTSTRNGGGIGIFSVFSGESAAEDILIQNTTISGNHADEHGGGVFVDNLGEQSVLLSHSTIAFNESDADSSGTGSGGGLFISQDDVRLDHAIIAGNQDNTGVAHDVAGDILASFSQVGEGANFLGPLADNGGPTLTHALLPGSPAINAGDLNAIAGVDDVPLFDQRGEGLDRIFSRIDIGAYEVQELGDLNLLVDTLVDESDGDFSRGDLSLREAIELANANPVPDTIRFDPIFAAIAGPLPATILLTMGELAITDSVEIVGLGAELLKIDASGNDPTPDENNGDGSRVLFVNAPIKTLIDVAIHGITFTGADSNQSGGAIFSRDNLSLREVSIRDNHSAAFGGGIAVFWSSSQPLPTLLINHSDIDNNTAVKRGGGVFSFGLIQISESNLTGNRTSDKGGAIWANQNRVNDANDFVFHGNLLSRNYSGDRGGGAYIEIGGRDPIRVDGNVFRENTAVGSGGGAYLSGNIDFIGNIVELNSSRSFGGGVSFAGGQSTVNGQLVKAIAKVFDSQFRSNSASTGGGVAQNTSTNVLSLDSSYFIGNVASHRGGGVAIFGESLINDSKVTDNFASVGGGIYVSGFSGNTDLSIVRSEILGNESSSTGGGIHTFATFTTIRDSTVAENIASTHGGGIYAQARSKVAGDDADGGRVSVSGSTIHNNQAGGRGGAIAVAGGISSNDVGASGGQVSLSNTTISANRAGTVGGGIFAGEPVALGTGETQPALVTAEHSTITDNTAESDLTARGSGGGVFIENGSVELDHTIIAGNRNNSGTANDIAGIVNSNFSLIGFGAEFLAPLADNGGPTFTHALLSGSPAINAGDPQAVSGANGIPEFDQRGNPFTRVSGRRIDIGAYEVQPLPGDFDGDGDSDDFDLAQWEADFGITENSTSDSDGDGDTDGSDFLNWQRTLGVVLPTVENRSLAERTSETELRVAAVDLALAADKMLNGPQYGRALFTYLDDTPDFVLDLALPSLHEAPRPVQRAASRAAFELLEVTASDEDAPDELDDELSALDELFALL